MFPAEHNLCYTHISMWQCSAPPISRDPTHITTTDQPQNNNPTTQQQINNNTTQQSTMK